MEYSSLSDSFTACPEGFKEFYNQRRRWILSTFVNIVDLISNYGAVLENNENISTFFIVYHFLMVIMTVLSPASVFLMLVGSLQFVFGWSPGFAFLANLIPLLVFILVCLCAKPDTQVIVAQVLSVIYIPFMMALLVQSFLHLFENGWSSLSTLSFMIVSVCLVLTAVLHPQELPCLPMGVIYYVTVPSMYLFHVVYSVFNLHAVSWGTREVEERATSDAEEDRNNFSEQAGSVLKWLSRRRHCDNNDNQSQIEMSRNLDDRGDTPSTGDEDITQAKNEPTGLGKGPTTITLPRKEEEFWAALIEKYLKPLHKNPLAEARTANDLMQYRNQMVLAFLAINSMWVSAISLLQTNKDLLTNLSITGGKSNLKLDPTGVMFFLVFASVLLVQLLGMLTHRIMTICHVISSVKAKPKSTFDKYAAAMVHRWQKLACENKNGSATSFEDVLTDTLDAIVKGDVETMRRLSRADHLRGTSVRMNDVLSREATLEELKARLG